MNTRLKQFALGSIALLTVMLLAASAQKISAAPPCLDTTVKNDGTSCPGTTQVCIGFASCQTFALALQNYSTNANTSNLDVSSNAYFSPVFPAWGCLGSSTLCTTYPTNNAAYWRSLGTSPYGINGSINNVQFSGLRPGMIYNETYSGTWTTVTDIATQSVSTWPGVSSVPVVSNLAPTSATISWNTPFPSDTEVLYGPNPASWLLDGSPVSSSALQAVDAASDGSTWAAGFGGLIEKRALAGWVAQGSPTSNFLTSISAYDGNNVWIAGFNGTVLHTTNGGGTWGVINPGPAINYNSIYSALLNTAWVVGDSGNGYFYDGASWNSRHPSTAVHLESVFSLDNHEIWVGGQNGTIWHSIDNGVTWSTQNSGVATSINSITSINGTELWAGTAGGVILHTVNGGASWTPFSTTSVYAVRAIHMLSTTKFWFATDYQAGFYNAGAVTLYGDPATQFGSAISDLTVINGTNIIAVGQQNRISSFTLCHYGTPNCDASQSSGSLVTTHAINLSGLSSGQPIFFAAESYGSGVGEGQFGSFTTTAPDTTPPVINFVNPPPPGPIYTNVTPFPVSGSASDTAPGTVQTVSLTNNGAAQTVTGTTSWSSSVVPVAGLNTLVATATDGGGNTDTDTSSLFFDNVKPTLSITSPANGVTVNATPTNITGNLSDNDQIASFTMTVNGGVPTNVTPAASWTASANLVVGSNTILMTATDRAGNVQTAQVTFNYVAPTFSLTAAPGSQTGFVGDVKTYTVTATSLNSFVGTVNLSAVSAPAGLGASFSAPSVSLTSGGSANSTLTITTTSVGGGTYTITATGISGAITKTANVTLILNAAPDFTISATPSPLNVVAGQSSSYQVAVSANNTFAGPVGFTVSGLPAGVTLTFNPLSVTLANSQTINTIIGNVTTLTTVVNGDYPLSITGNGTNTANGATVTHAAAVILHISPAPDIGLTFLPAQNNPPLQAGSATATSYNGTITSLNGFGGAGTTVALSVTSNYSGPGLTLNLQPSSLIIASGDVKNASLNVTASNAVPGGTYTITIKADGGIASKQVTVNLVVTEDTTPPVISSININPNYNNVRVSWTTDELANSTITIYTDAAHTGLVGTKTDPLFCPGSCHDVLYQPLNPLTTYYLTVSSTDTSPSALTTTVTTDSGGQPLQFTTLDTPDTTPPVVTMSSPADSATPPDVFGSLTVAGTASDDKNVSFVKVQITNQTTGLVEFDVNVPCSGPTCSYSYDWNTSQLGAPGNGPHAVKAVAQDVAGNLSTPVVHYVNVANDYTDPQLTDGPTATNLQCTAVDCQITISWSTDDQSTSEVGYDTPAPAFCDQVTNVCTYSQHKQYDNTAPADSSPAYTFHQVTLTGLLKNVIYHYRVFSCNRSGLCLQAG